MQRIVIKNFGPIKDVDIPIHDFMIFIGPQASGKSTIAKAIYFFREIPTLLYDSLFKTVLNIDKISASYVRSIIESEIRQSFDKSLGSIPSPNFELKFMFSEEVWISTTAETDKTTGIIYFHVALSKGIVTEIEKFANELDVLDEEDSNKTFKRKVNISLNGIVLLNFVSDIFGQSFPINSFIPAGRNVFSILANQIQFYEGQSTDSTIKEFAKRISELRTKNYPVRGLDMHSDSQVEVAMNLYRKVLKGSYLHEQFTDKIQLENGVDISLEKASSGQQESIWPLLSLFTIIKEKIESFTVFEEPEAHLYPESQKYISDLIALCANQKGNQVIITTHSPYILGAINNLLYANEVGKEHSDKVEKVVDKSLWLEYDKVMTYFVDEGKVRSIMDEEMRMIKNEEIDSASRIINQEYDSLSNIKYSE